ncbi:MAG TPA: glycosyltransferase family 4 protein [Candidatus Bathyarchaeia archaeon]
MTADSTRGPDEAPARNPIILERRMIFRRRPEWSQSTVTVLGNPVTNISSGKFLVNFCKVLSALADEVNIVNDGAEGFQLSGANIVPATRILAVRKTESRREFGPARRFLAAQFCLALGLIRCIRRTDLVILFPVVMLAPALVARIFRRPLVLYEGQDVLDERAAEKSSVAGSVKYAFVFLLRTIVLHMVNAIVVEGEGVIRQNHLDGLRSKTYRWHQYVDTQTYQVKRPIAARGELVGFLGTLDRRKGVLEFARAVRLVNARKKSVRFVIGGEGPLRGAVEAILADFVVDGTVRIVGLVQESALCDFYNDLRLFVLPSTSEGLPNSILESMACGTPVLATAVGAVPDVITDGETGFLLATNDPKVLAGTILRALDHADLPLISLTSRAEMDNEFQFGRSVDLCAQLFAKMRSALGVPDVQSSHG